MAGHLYTATVTWQRDPAADFAKGRYSRGHLWRFDGGIEVKAAASPGIVPKPFNPEDTTDPEEALVASISSCHMLTFLDLARRAGFLIDSYEDTAEGELAKTAEGRFWVARVTLRPRIVFAGDKRPEAPDLDRLHHEAHDQCIIANSIKTEIRVEQRVA